MPILLHQFLGILDIPSYIFFLNDFEIKTLEEHPKSLLLAFLKIVPINQVPIVLQVISAVF
jgi:hypothetical protein